MNQTLVKVTLAAGQLCTAILSTPIIKSMFTQIYLSYTKIKIEVCNKGLLNIKAHPQVVNILCVFLFYWKCLQFILT